MMKTDASVEATSTTNPIDQTYRRLISSGVTGITAIAQSCRARVRG